MDIQTLLKERADFIAALESLTTLNEISKKYLRYRIEEIDEELARNDIVLNRSTIKWN